MNKEETNKEDGLFNYAVDHKQNPGHVCNGVCGKRGVKPNDTPKTTKERVQNILDEYTAETMEFIGSLTLGKEQPPLIVAKARNAILAIVEEEKGFTTKMQVGIAEKERQRIREVVEGLMKKHDKSGDIEKWAVLDDVLEAIDA